MNPSMIAAGASSWAYWTIAALASRVDGAAGIYWARAASSVYLHYSYLVSNSHDQFIIRRRLNDKSVN